MRFIIRELPYERPLAAGKWRYGRDGQPTGAVEAWRLTAAASGYRFLRVDLDARQAASGHSTLYHLVLNEDGRPERLTYRFWGHDLDISGNVLLEDKSLASSRLVNGVRYEDAVSFEAGCSLWFPSSVGLGLLANCAQGYQPPSDGLKSTVTLHAVGTGERPPADALFALQRVEVQLSMGDVERMSMMAMEVEVRPFTIRWRDQVRTLWLNEDNWPLKMKRNDGLEAVETRYIRYV